MENTFSRNVAAFEAVREVAGRLRYLFDPIRQSMLKEGHYALTMVSESMKLQEQFGGRYPGLDEFIRVLRDAPKWCNSLREQRRYEDLVKESYIELTSLPWPTEE